MSLEESFFGSETPSFAETKARYKSDRELYMKLLNAEAAGKERSDLHEMLSGGMGKTDSECQIEDVLAAYDDLEKRNQRRSSASQIAIPHLRRHIVLIPVLLIICCC